MTYRLSDEDREAVRRMAYAGSYSRDKADRYVATVEAIVAREVAAAVAEAEHERATETRRADKAVERARHYEGQFRQREHEPDWRKRAEAAEAKVAAALTALDEVTDPIHAGGCYYRHQSGEVSECNSCAAHLVEAALRAALGEARP